MSTIINNVKNHCIDLLTHSRCNILPFHSVQHTLEVFKNVQIIGTEENLTENELEILKIAALFHDTGISEVYKDHENISANNAYTYLSNLKYHDINIVAILNCIKATRMPQKPSSKLESVICDADLFHLSSKEFIVKNESLRMEWMKYMDLVFIDKDWYQLNLNFLKEHNYHTQYGKTILEENKQNNIDIMKKLLKTTKK